MADEVALLKQFSREVRNAAGLERTPAQLRTILKEMRCKSMYRAITTLMDNRDAMLSFCKSIQLEDHARIPSSEELGI